MNKLPVRFRPLPGGWDTMMAESVLGFPKHLLHDDDTLELAGFEDEGEAPPPPPAIGQDERRMQVRAFNCWSGLLEGRRFPALADLDLSTHPDFGTHGVLLDFSDGIDDPGVRHIGVALAAECGCADPESIRHLSEAPHRSLLARICEYYLQILASQAPIGFESQFVNREGRQALCRGILLPFSSDDRTIDHIFAVLNWKEFADEQLVETVSVEVDKALRDKREARCPGEPDSALPSPLGRRLRAITPRGFDMVEPCGGEFPLLIARRLSSGEVMLLGEVREPGALLERAAERLLD